MTSNFSIDKLVEAGAWTAKDTSKRQRFHGPTRQNVSTCDQLVTYCRGLASDFDYWKHLQLEVFEGDNVNKVSTDQLRAYIRCLIEEGANQLDRGEVVDGEQVMRRLEEKHRRLQMRAEEASSS